MTMGVKLEGDWEQAMISIGALRDPAKINSVIDTVVEAEAKFATKELKKGIESQAPGGKAYKPPAPSTLRVRQFMGQSSKKRLIVSGTLVKSIMKKRVRSGVYWAGVPNKVVKGRNLADIMELNERGATIVRTVTHDMQLFLFAAFGGAPKVGSQITTRIPASPTIEPVFDTVFSVNRARLRIQRRTTRLVNKMI